MPFETTCPAHPEADLSCMDLVVVHAHSHHPGERLQDVAEGCRTKFVTHEEARGIVRSRTFHCNVCAAPVTTTDMARLPYCDGHMDPDAR